MFLLLLYGFVSLTSTGAQGLTLSTSLPTEAGTNIVSYYSSSYSLDMTDPDPCQCPGTVQPNINHSSIYQYFSSQRLVNDSTGEVTWVLSVNVTWERPNENVTEYDVAFYPYSESMMDVSECDNITGKYGFVGTMLQPFVRVDDLAYTSKYKFKIWSGLSNCRYTGNLFEVINTPDCYAETKDKSFCEKQSVDVSGEPVNITIRSITMNLTNGEKRIILDITWESPVQLNGIIIYFYLGVSFEHGRFDPFQKAVAQNETTFEVLYGLGKNVKIIEGMQYVLQVTPFVDQRDGSYLKQGRIGSLPFTAVVTDTITPVPRTSPPPIQRESPAAVIVIIVLLFLIVILLIAAVLVKKYYFKEEEEDESFYRLPNSLKGNNYSGLPTREVDPILAAKEVSHDLIQIEEELGKGQFGIVYKGIANGLNNNNKDETIIVAIKTTKPGAFNEVKEDLLDEMKLIVELGSHPNLLPLLGCCTIREPYYLITEYMKYGDLLHFLRRCREQEYAEQDPMYNLSEMSQVQIAQQIAKGMEYVATTRYYHGDLAARNVLVGDNLTVKISDFGLADDIYSRGYKRREEDQKIPIKWVSLEAILKGILSSEGDVWSFGVVLYEIYTLGGTPYPNINGKFLVTQLREGYRMEQPKECPDRIYEMMLECWHEDPKARPSFGNLWQRLDEMLVEQSDYFCFELEECEGEKPEITDNSRPVSVPNFYSQTPMDERLQTAATIKTNSFAPIIEEDAGVSILELSELTGNYIKHEQDKDEADKGEDKEEKDDDNEDASKHLIQEKIQEVNV